MNEKLNLTEVDFRIQDAGSIVVLHPQNDAAGDWLYENLDHDEILWWGGGVVIDPSYLPSIIEGIEADGLDVA
jgi:hypothetical protein